MANDSIGQDLMNLPLGETVRSVAMAIADAQFQFDKASLVQAEFMTGKHVLRNPDGSLVLDETTNAPQTIDSRVYFGYTYDEEGTRVSQQLSMMELGFAPNFYQFVDTAIEMKLAVRMSRSSNGEAQITSTPVDASYASSYNYNATLACNFKTKIVPIPPPAILEERIRELMDAHVETDRLEAEAQAETPEPPANGGNAL